jgi:hypothetical protein
VTLGAVFARAPIHDAVTGATPSGVKLALSPLYVLLSPLSCVLDTIGLLSVGQHIAFGVSVILFGMLVARRRGLLVGGAIALAVLLVLYASAAVLPRPMAKIVVSDPGVVVVDFHSHTNASEDARHGFSPEDNREWHRRGGFDAAYISDHRSFAGAEAGRSRNPAHAGDGTVLLSAYEGRYLGTFEIFLSLTRVDSARLMNARRWLREGKLQSGRVPRSVVALPGPLMDVQGEERDHAPHIAAIEISDGSPRGLSQTDRDRLAIIRRADSLGIALVSGTNNHGWGRVIPAWTLVNIPNWRALAPDSLGAAIEAAVSGAPRSAIRVVERQRPTVASPVAMIFTAPATIAQLLATLTTAERLAWLIWIWAAWLIWGRWRRRPVGRQLTSTTANPS